MIDLLVDFYLLIVITKKKGSKNMSYDSSHLTTPDIKWIGIRPSDLGDNSSLDFDLS